MAEEPILNPDIPYVSMIVGGVYVGKTIAIKGMVKQPFAADDKKFAIDLCCGLLISGDHMDNKALHFNPRFDRSSGFFSKGDHELVLNSYISNSWGKEDRYENPFTEGQAFEMTIKVLNEDFEIVVLSSNKMNKYYFGHRARLENIKTIAITGCVRIDSIEFASAADGDVESRPQRTIVTERPTIPFVYELPSGGFCHPEIMRFTVTPSLSGSRFEINYMTRNECAFHFRVDMPNSNQPAAVVRNSTGGGSWLKEEREMSIFPFSRGITHDITIQAFDSYFSVNVDGAPFTRFFLRSCSPNSIDKVSVKGDLMLIRFAHIVQE